MLSIIFASNNENKVKELQAAIGSSVRIISLKEAGFNRDIPEPFDTLEENASEKSRVILEATGLDCFSEDTGLEVKSLDYAPGVKSARYAGEERNDRKNIEKLLSELRDKEDRSAQFRTVISLRWNGQEYFFEGICEGKILQARQGDNGFGYDPVFRPAGSDQSFASMTLEEKNRFSHRKKAADKLVLFLQEALSNKK